jgi:outer membrane murein-binding lipoprotein Lpp
MKRSILMLAAATFIASAVLSGCSTPAEKVEDAQSNVTEANENLDKANEAYQADIENYRKETAAKIAANDQTIAEFKARKESEKSEARAEYEKKLSKLEEKNSDMKKKMNDYKAEGKEKWIIFKAEFGRGMDELGGSFKDLVVKK